MSNALAIAAVSAVLQGLLGEWLGGRDLETSLGRIPVNVDYVAAVDPQTLKPVDVVTGPTLFAAAARVGTTRLIDNVLVEPPAEPAPRPSTPATSEADPHSPRTM